MVSAHAAQRPAGRITDVRQRGATYPGPRLSQLRALLGDVAVAKAELRKQLAQRGIRPATLATARRNCLLALEAYAAALERRRWPIPHQMHRDIRLHQALCELDLD